MTGFVRCAALLVSLAATARAAPPPPPALPPRLLVLPLPPATGLSADAARMFDARLLVALDDSKRVVTVTPATEPDCAEAGCLIDRLKQMQEEKDTLAINEPDEFWYALDLAIKEANKLMKGTW